MSTTITYDSGLQLVITVRENGDAGVKICPGEMDSGYLRIPAEHRQAIADALALTPSPSDSLTVRIDAGGAAHLLALDDGGGCGITVPKEKRREIGLEIVGPVDEAMVERAETRLREIFSADVAFRGDWWTDQARYLLEAALFGEPA